MAENRKSEKKPTSTWIVFLSGAVTATAVLVAINIIVTARSRKRDARAADGTATGRTADPKELQQLRMEVLTLKRLVGSLMARVNQTARPAPVAPGTAPETDSGAVPGPSADRARPPRRITPRYVKFITPHKGLTITQVSDGSLTVSNTDPSLSMKRLKIKAVRTDGKTDTVTITVPPPGR